MVLDLLWSPEGGLDLLLWSGERGNVDISADARVLCLEPDEIQDGSYRHKFDERLYGIIGEFLTARRQS